METFALVGMGALLSTATAFAAPGRSPDDLPDRPVFSTVAGSGQLGFDDGPGSSATFVSPTGLAYDATGNLYVADRDAQRIRKISPDGTVRTIAGIGAMLRFGSGVGGGFSDGPIATAQFNMPEAVLPLPDGTILVADTKNFCLRAIAKGVVTTFAGDHTVYKGADGPVANATFSSPRSLARTPNGTIYVADPPNGVRAITNGTVSTLHFPDSGAVIAVDSVPSSPNFIAVATATTIETIDVATGTVATSVPLESGFVKVAAREGGRPFGPPSAIKAFSLTEIVATDPLQSTIRLLQIDTALGDNYTRVLTAPPDEYAAFGSAGFADGPGENARVDEPLGIAISPQGTIAVADTGNRRIRLLQPFNRTTHISVDLTKSELPSAPDAREFRIAIVGNSYIWFDQAWHESIGGMIEDDLLARHFGAPRIPRIYPIMHLGLPTMEALSIIDNELSDGNVDMVVLDVSNYGQLFSPDSVLQQYPTGWQDVLTAGLRGTSKGLTQSREGFIVVDHPGAADFPDEFAYRRLPKGLVTQNGDTVELRDPAAIEIYHDEMSDALMKSGAPVLDLWPAFLSSYDSANRVPLFESWDHHLSIAGRRLVAEGIAQNIIARQTTKPAKP